MQTGNRVHNEPLALARLSDDRRHKAGLRHSSSNASNGSAVLNKNGSSSALPEPKPLL